MVAKGRCGACRGANMGPLDGSRYGVAIGNIEWLGVIMGWSGIGMG